MSTTTIPSCSPNSTPTSLEGATVVVNADGTYSYDPSSSASIAALSRGQFLEDTFAYIIDDGNTTTTGLVTIIVNGVQHAIISQDDDEYKTSENTPLMVDAASGLLSNDTDVDVLDTLTVIAFDATSTMGAVVQVMADGSFTYDASDATVSPLLDALKAGEFVDDTFTYMVSDGNGSEETATVTITVAGVSDGRDDAYLTDLNVNLVVGAGGLLLNDGLDTSEVVVAMSDTVSSLLGVDVTINADGSFTYDSSSLDPEVLTINGFMNDDEFAFDQFSYTARSSVAPFTEITATVQIAIDVAVLAPPPVVTPIGTVTTPNGVLTIQSMQPSGDPGFDGTIGVQIVDLSNNMFQVVATALEDASGALYSDGDSVDLGTYEFGVDFTSIEFIGWAGDDDFEMPSDLSAPLTASTGAGNDRVSAGSGDDTIMLGAGDDHGIGKGGDDLIQGEAGDDVLRGGSGKDRLEGGDDDDLMNGGFGLDILEGGPGADVYQDPSGDASPSLLIGPNLSEGDHFELFGSMATVPATSLIVGIKSEKQSLEDMNFSAPSGVTLGLVASLSDDNAVLTINGPTLYGYTLTGNWSVEDPLGDGAERFVSSGLVTMSTGIGDLILPIPAGATAFVIPTTVDPIDNVGQVDLSFGIVDTFVTLFDALVAEMTTDGSTLSSFFDATVGVILGETGLDINLPDIRFGLATGAEIKDLLEPAPPVVDSLPYFYFQINTGNNLVKFGNTSFSVPNSFDFTIIFEPNDPYFYYKASAAGVAFAAGWSTEGYFPFTPLQTPKVFQNEGINLFGNLHLQGKFPIATIAGITFKADASAVIDLNADGTGPLPGMLGENSGDLFDDNTSILDVFASAISDIAIGINGKITAGLNNFSVTVGTGTAVFKDNILALKGGTAQPFAGTILDFIEVASTTIDAFADFDTGEFGFEYVMEPPMFFGVSTGGARHSFSITNANEIYEFTFFPGFPPIIIQTNPNIDVIARFNTGGDVPVIGAFAEISGRVNFNTGFVTLQGEVKLLDLDFGPFDASAGFDVLLSNVTESGDFGFCFIASAFAKGSIDLGVLGNASASVSGDIEFNISGSGYSVSGSARARASYSTVFGSVNVSASGSFSNSGVRINLPSPVPDINVSWGSASGSSGALTSNSALLVHGDGDSNATSQQPASALSAFILGADPAGGEVAGLASIVVQIMHSGGASNVLMPPPPGTRASATRRRADPLADVNVVDSVYLDSSDSDSLGVHEGHLLMSRDFVEYPRSGEYPSSVEADISLGDSFDRALEDIFDEELVPAM